MGVTSLLLELDYRPWSNGKKYYGRKKCVLDVGVLINEQMFKDYPKTNSITSSDIVYFGKNSDVPRYKLEEYAKAKNITINKTNRVEYANTFILNLEEMMKVVYGHHPTTHSYYVIPKSDFHHIQWNVVDDLKEKGYDQAIVSKKIISEHNIQDFNSYPVKNFKSFWVSGKTNKIYGQEQKQIDTYEIIHNYFVKHQKLPKLVFDKTIIQDMSSKLGDTIDENMYSSLKTMFESNDQHNWNLATDIVCNSDYEKSKLYILFLIYEFSSKFTTNANSNAFNKAFSDVKNSFYRTSMEEFINNLLSDSSLDREAILKFWINDLNSRFKRVNKEKNIVNIKNIIL